MSNLSLTQLGHSLLEELQHWFTDLIPDNDEDLAVNAIAAIDLDLAHLAEMEAGFIGLEQWLSSGIEAESWEVECEQLFGSSPIVQEVSSLARGAIASPDFSPQEPSSEHIQPTTLLNQSLINNEGQTAEPLNQELLSPFANNKTSRSPRSWKTQSSHPKKDMHIHPIQPVSENIVLEEQAPEPKSRPFIQASVLETEISSDGSDRGTQQSTISTAHHSVEASYPAPPSTQGLKGLAATLQQHPFDQTWLEEKPSADPIQERSNSHPLSGSIASPSFNPTKSQYTQKLPLLQTPSEKPPKSPILGDFEEEKYPEIKELSPIQSPPLVGDLGGFPQTIDQAKVLHAQEIWSETTPELPKRLNDSKPSQQNHHGSTLSSTSNLQPNEHDSTLSPTSNLQPSTNYSLPSSAHALPSLPITPPELDELALENILAAVEQQVNQEYIRFYGN